jgi:hypothetical protein
MMSKTDSGARVPSQLVQEPTWGSVACFRSSRSRQSGPVHRMVSRETTVSVRFPYEAIGLGPAKSECVVQNGHQLFLKQQWSGCIDGRRAFAGMQFFPVLEKVADSSRITELPDGQS